MQYLLQNLEWLQERMELQGEGEMQDYWIVDCPGQIELYSHVPIMRTILDRMQHQWGFTPGCMVSVCCIDSTFCCDAQKMISGQLLALSTMIALELPHINVLTKGDLLPERDIDAMLNLQSASQLWELEQDRTSLFAMPREMASIVTELEDYDSNNQVFNTSHPQQKADKTQEQLKKQQKLEQRRRQRHRLTDNICGLLDDYTMVSFVPLNVNDEESIDHVLITVDHAVQYGEDNEVRGAEADDDMLGVNPNDDDFDGGGDDE
ncbi:loop GTPase 3 [Seminavis robusta]|uniref:GPN-loop GTPase 3 n=1 Tax=Seminavis robusta TaxID=568900 RepID=A0A9N8E8V4_9STRA|nr:loop GTPase 3 [Seminavis robusta]|eukprot:Sro813_g206120.1 loop GTPase 3 (263) ;mRNA; f:7094-7882